MENVRLYRCKCKQVLHNMNLTEINKHRATHGDAPLNDFDPSLGRLNTRKARNGKTKKKKKQLYITNKLDGLENQLAITKDKLQKANAKIARLESMNNKTLGFYGTITWGRLSYIVKTIYAKRCMLCNKNAGPLCADHIYPRSLRPDLELNIRNIQVLCLECNRAKSNLDSRDFRSLHDIQRLEKFIQSEQWKKNKGMFPMLKDVTWQANK